MFGRNEYRDINVLLNRKFEEKKRLIAVHRCAWGGNVCPSSRQAFIVGQKLGGDMMEIDVSKAADGKLWVFHDGTEPHHFHIDRNIETMSSEEIKELEFFNSIGEPSGKHLQTLDELLSWIGDEVLFNIDRGWTKLHELDELLQSHPEKIHQALIKTPVAIEYLDFFTDCPRKYMYMPIVKSMEDVRLCLSYADKINMVGMEVIALTPDCDLFQDETIDFIRSKGLFVWVNSITLGKKDSFRLFSYLDDDKAIMDGEESSWGEMFEKNIDVIQTDWPALLKPYRDAYFGL